MKKLLVLIILIPVIITAQTKDSLETYKPGIQKWQFSFVTNIYLTTIAINKPYNIDLLKGYETQIINGANIFFRGGEHRAKVSSYFEYDLLFRINKHFTKRYFFGIEAGSCLRYMIRNGAEEDDGMNLKLGAETGYLVAESIYITAKVNGLITADYYGASTFGLGFKYSF